MKVVPAVNDFFCFILIVPVDLLIAPPRIGFYQRHNFPLKAQRNIRRGIIEPGVGRGWSQTKAAAQEFDHFAVGMIDDLLNAGDRSALCAAALYDRGSDLCQLRFVVFHTRDNGPFGTGIPNRYNGNTDQ